MHAHNIDKWTHAHHFHGHADKAEKSTKRVVWLTVIMMVGEITAGIAFGSMALLADGWHMGTHAAALCITLFAYRYARTHAANDEFSFGTGKVGVLGGYSSAIVLGIAALLMAAESVTRLINPESIRFNEAIGVAVLGLLVNIISAFMLKEDHHHHHHSHTHTASTSAHQHDDAHAHEHEHEHHHDHNLRAAYLHVLADALTSVLAIIALIAGKSLGWVWLDPMMGIVGAVIITKWAIGLGKETSRILLDRMTNEHTKSAIIDVIEKDTEDRVTDIHIWHLNANQLSAIVSIVTHTPKEPDHYKKRISHAVSISHLTVEVQECRH